MKITLALLDRIAGKAVNRANAKSLIVGFDAFPAGIDRPHRLAQFLAQITHESGDLKYDRELWGPTGAQRRYDTRTDLGNTPAVDGDGFANRGMGPIQLTGGDNRRAFHAWCIAEGFTDAPDFVGTEALLSDPWEGLSAIWFWTSRNLNRYADAGDFENITRRINGGTNGFDDRARRYGRATMVMLGQRADALRAWQMMHRLKPDGIPGPLTRAALHKALVAVDDKPDEPTLDERVAALESRVKVLEEKTT